VDVRTLSTQQRRELYEWALATASRITRSRTAAESLTQEAFARLDTTRRWNPGGATSLQQHMYGILKSLLSHERRSDSKRGEAEQKFGIEEAALSDAGRSAETMSLDRADRKASEALATERVAKLRARLAGFPLDLLILDLMTDEVTKRADLAQRTGRSPDEVKTALARIRRHMESIRAAERGEDEEVA
jgi:DNA-directed RNA polymerase specialized sigma24 family protein